MARLVTGAAGFIGFYVTNLLLDRGEEVIGLDNLNDYYDVSLKQGRLAQLQSRPGFIFSKNDINDGEALNDLFRDYKPSHVIHLAAHAGVRYSLNHPDLVTQSNVMGFLNILEACRHYGTEHLVYASTSAVYGDNTEIPFSVNDRVDKPVSIYGASKRCNELMAYTYSRLFQIPLTGLRFFTVYGPWGRPDMSYYKFTHNIINGLPIDVYNNGNHSRDFTYIDDIAEWVIRAVDKLPADNYQLYNLGNRTSTKLMYYISVLEKLIGKKAVTNMLPMQPGDMPDTCADIGSTSRDLEYTPRTDIEKGLGKFVNWYREYHGIGQ
jgi:UDP-glucuronate 4-epimerase